MCMYIYIYMNMHIYIYVYTHIYIYIYNIDYTKIVTTTAFGVWRKSNGWYFRYHAESAHTDKEAEVQTVRKN